MRILDWFAKETNDGDEDSVVVKVLTSKGTSKQSLPVTVGDIKKGIALDANGYPNEVVLFLRLNKKDS